MARLSKKEYKKQIDKFFEQIDELGTREDFLRQQAELTANPERKKYFELEAEKVHNQFFDVFLNMLKFSRENSEKFVVKSIHKESDKLYRIETKVIKNKKRSKK
jgi:hypothetical protein